MRCKLPSGRYRWCVVSVLTQHSGGARISNNDTGENGGVNANGQLFTGQTEKVHKGLVVCDGTIVPAALGVNPFATITALAERSVEKVAEEFGIDIDYKRKNGEFFPSQLEVYQTLTPISRSSQPLRQACPHPQPRRQRGRRESADDYPGCQSRPDFRRRLQRDDGRMDPHRRGCQGLVVRACLHCCPRQGRVQPFLPDCPLLEHPQP